MHKCSSPLYIVFHILLYILTQAIMHTYLTHKPQAWHVSSNLSVSLSHTHTRQNTDASNRSCWIQGSCLEDCDSVVYSHLHRGVRFGVTQIRAVLAQRIARTDLFQLTNAQCIFTACDKLRVARWVLLRQHAKHDDCVCKQVFENGSFEYPKTLRGEREHSVLCCNH